MRPYHIYLIRHGMTEANLEKRYVGVTDVPLCKEGIAELLSLKERYDYPNVLQVYSSPLCRSIQSARLLYPQMTPVVVEELREMSLGVFEGKTVQELSELPAYRDWLDSEKRTTPEGAEAGEAFAARVTAGLDRVIRNMMKNRVTDAAVVTHADVISTLLALCGLPRRSVLDWQTGCGRGYTLLINAGLWANERLVEVFTPIPYGTSQEEIQLEYQRTLSEETP